MWGGKTELVELKQQLLPITFRRTMTDLPMPVQPSLCFCTTAFGAVYVKLAQLLAEDLRQFAPHAMLILLTDRPEAFQGYANVQAQRHWCRGVKSYHERRFAIGIALRIAPTVIYLDADLRICAPLPVLKLQPGLTARSAGSMRVHLRQQFEREHLTAAQRHKRQVIEAMAAKVGLNWQVDEAQFINEFLFVVQADQGRELEFLRLWGELAIYADQLGLHQHPTYAMALAALKSGFSVHQSDMPGLDFFDDRIERVRISKGQVPPDSKAEYFEQQRQIEQARGKFARRWQKAKGKGLTAYHRCRVSYMSTVCPERLLAITPPDSQP